MKPRMHLVEINIFSLNNVTVNTEKLLCKSKGPGAKNDTTESPGCFNQILTFESGKWSPVATF